MKVLFVGPTLYGLVRAGRMEGATDIVVRGPAAQGAIFQAVREGATVIGLVDGRYDDVAAPWHKEILDALSNGVHVLGAGSLGALRAAECAAFGMAGIGAVFERYRIGRYVDDADVAQSHGPEEMEFLPLSEPMVNIEATLEMLLALGKIDADRSAHIRSVARGIFFKQLTVSEVIGRLGLQADAAATLQKLMTEHRVDQKRIDALALVDEMRRLPDARRTELPDWKLSQPHQWRRFVEGA